MRLNKTIREDIVSAALNSTFKDREIAIRAAGADFADDVYRHVLGDNLLVVSVLPEGFLPAKKELRVFLGEEARHPTDLLMSESRRIPYCTLARGWSSETLRITDKQIIKQWAALEKKRAKLEKDKNDLKRSLNSVVNSVHSINRLQDVWPESSKFIPAEVKQKENLPAVVADDLNTMIKKMKRAA